ncbi:DMT family transporter [Paenibacillus psychroresistens]|uniref:DMT family transporter n=1 Tax=Paenibacillus psychroresistens TaxID=1778678 RepID=A0A6B8RG88_9BACL|nr:DMT family transporter [Paenibacillus psychroresistens]QGQ94957.1 DMT family transporter [Paenibacillus psychroresistens]
MQATKAPHRFFSFLPHLSLIIVYIIFGINISSMKLGGQEWDPFVFNGLRFLSITPLLWLYTYYYCRKRKLSMRMKSKDFMLIVVLGVITGLGMEALLSYALQYSNAANGSVLGRGLMPIVTVIISLALREMGLTWRIMVGLPLALLSAVVIVSGSSQGFHLNSDSLRGDSLLLLRSVFGAVYLIGVSRLVGKYPLPLLISMEVTFAGICLLPFVLNMDFHYFASVSAAGWISLIYTSVFATILGYTLHNWSLGHLGPFKSSVYGYLLPITGALAGLWILKEHIGLNQILGGLGVLLAMYLVQKDRMQVLRKSA